MVNLENDTVVDKSQDINSDAEKIGDGGVDVANVWSVLGERIEREPVGYEDFEKAVEDGQKIAVTENMGPIDVKHIGIGQPGRSTIQLYETAMRAFETGEDQTITVSRMGVEKTFTVSGQIAKIGETLSSEYPDLSDGEIRELSLDHVAGAANSMMLELETAAEQNDGLSAFARDDMPSNYFAIAMLRNGLDPSELKDVYEAVSEAGGGIQEMSGRRIGDYISKNRSWEPLVGGENISWPEGWSFEPDSRFVTSE